MPDVELTLRNSGSSCGDVRAWFLPGDSPLEWLREIAAWPIDQSTIRIIPIREAIETRIAGVLAIPPSSKFRAGGHCVPFRRLRGNIYLPVDAEFFPPIAEEEIAELFTGDYIYVWVPGRGLTATETGDVLFPSDLITLPSPPRINWDRAVPGIAFTQRLIGILPDKTFSANDIIEDGRDDIGDRAAEISQLPKSPQEPLSGIAGVAGRALMVGTALPLLGLANLASALGKVLSLGSSGNNRSTGAGSGRGRKSLEVPGLSALGDFANQLLGRVTKALEDMRHKEIGRLLHMLDSDPDQGLKFAIPFGGGEHRGLAAPGSRLGMRNTDFSLRRLGGGGPADIWNMSWDYQQKLVTKYRELASREIRIGRHRRAAYIYAELLGDIKSAASALEEGGHFREAAVLHKDRLNDAHAAAQCLERGELWHEAIEAYRELGKHEKVGDLLVRIEQRVAADEAYHCAANELLEQNERLGAAQIYEEKLNDVELALKTLDGGWPDSPQAKLCVRAGFALRGRVGYHSTASERIEELHADAERLTRQADVAELLAEISEQYPEMSVCNTAVEFSRQIIVGRMRIAQRAEAERLVSTLGRLFPTDRLLQRDGRRFLQGQSAKRAALVPVQNFLFSRSPKKLQLINQFQLDLKGMWSAATTVSDVILIAGILDKRIVFARCDSEGNVEKNLTPWPRFPVASNCALQLHAQRSPINIFAIGEQSLPIQSIFATTEKFPPLSAGTPTGHGVVWGAAGGSLGQTWAIESREDPALVCVGLTGTVISTQSLADAVDAPWDFAVTPLPMHATRDGVLLGVGSALLSVRNRRIETLMRFPSRITSMSGSQPFAAPLVSISLEEGAVFVRHGFEGFARPFATDMQSPLTLLNRGNFIIAADEHRIEVYEWDHRESTHKRLTLIREINNDAGQPIALLPTPQTDRFIAICSSGTVSVYSL